MLRPLFGVLLLLFSARLVLADEAARQGIDAYQAGDYQSALRLFQEAAGRGDADGQFGLGTLYFDGQAVDRDMPKANRWFRAAAEQGHPRAQFNLGNTYIFGRGVGVDPLQAAYWWRKAARNGFPNACYNLGVYYLDHASSAAVRELGIAWLRAAAEKGWDAARARLRELNESWGLEGVERDWSREPLRSEAQLLTWDPDAYTVQFFSGGSKRSAIQFMGQAQLARSALLYRFPQGERVLWNVVFRHYDTKQEAIALIGRMRPELQRGQPWPRRVTDVQQSIRADWKHLEAVSLDAGEGVD